MLEMRREKNEKESQNYCLHFGRSHQPASASWQLAAPAAMNRVFFSSVDFLAEEKHVTKIQKPRSSGTLFFH